jgi:hypothetical protein
MSIVMVPHYAVRCEVCETVSSPKITERAATLAFDEYLGVVLSDGRALCDHHAGRIERCTATTNGEHLGDEFNEGYCLVCGLPVIVR